jgi:hypothetical protein
MLHEFLPQLGPREPNVVQRLVSACHARYALTGADRFPINQWFNEFVRYWSRNFREMVNDENIQVSLFISKAGIFS